MPLAAKKKTFGKASHFKRMNANEWAAFNEAKSQREAWEKENSKV